MSCVAPPHIHNQERFFKIRNTLLLFNTVHASLRSSNCYEYMWKLLICPVPGFFVVKSFFSALLRCLLQLHLPIFYLHTMSLMPSAPFSHLAQVKIYQQDAPHFLQIRHFVEDERVFHPSSSNEIIHSLCHPTRSNI